MAQYKLIRLFRTLSPQELLEAKKYVDNRRQKDCTRLYRMLEKTKEEQFKAKDLKKSLFVRAFPSDKYDDGKMRKLMTRLSHMLSSFLIDNELAKYEDQKQALLIRSLEQKNDYKLFQETVEKRILKLDNERKRGTRYYFEKFQLFQSLYFHPATSKFEKHNYYFQQYLFYQERYTILSSLIASAEYIARKRTLSTVLQTKFLEAALARVSDLEEHCPLIISIFKDLILLIQGQKKQSDLSALKEQLVIAFDQMDEKEQRMALKLSIFYASPFSNSGQKNHTVFILDIYRLGMLHGLLQNGQNVIETTLFMNIAITAATAGELEWSKKFIFEYSHQLEEKEKEIAIALCMAGWHYHQGLQTGETAAFDQASFQLNLIPTRSNEKFDLRARSLQLRIEIEQYLAENRLLDEVLDKARNFERHLKTNKNYSNQKRKAYLAFIRYCRRLVRIKGDPGRKQQDIEDLTADLANDKISTLKQWLIQKVEAL